MHRHVVEQALVEDLNDVSAGLADDAGDLGERAPGESVISERSRTSRPLRTMPRISTEDEDARIDVAATQHDADLLTLEALRGSASRAAMPAAPAPSATSFCWISSISTARSSLSFVDQHDLVDEGRARSPR